MRWSWAIGFATSVVSPLVHPLDAQLRVPDMPMAAMGRSVLPISAAEGAYHVVAAESRLKENLSIYDPTYPIDSMHQQVLTAGARWLANLETSEVRGIQLDPSGLVAIAANDEAYARAQIAARLATPGLSMNDRGYTYLTAIQAFSNSYFPKRLADAERYLQQLDALGDSAARWQFLARVDLVKTYYHLGRSADIVRHGARAIELANVIPFNDRRIVYAGGGRMYAQYITALTGQGSAALGEIARANAVLEAATVPPQAWLALSPAYARVGEAYAGMFAFMRKASSLLGTRGAPIVSNFWLNRPSHDSATIALDDGKIRVFELAGVGCAPCLAALQGVQRIAKRYPQIEGMFLTATGGSWGNRFVEPDEEVGHLKQFFDTVAKLSMPVGIWKAKKILNEDGGMTPENAGPNFEHYPTVKMSVWVVDGHGIVRQYFDTLDREQEIELARVVEFLLREAGQLSSDKSP